MIGPLANAIGPLGRARGVAVSTLLDSLVAYWKLDEASGTRNDSVGTSHLTSNNSVGSAAGKVGNAATFVAASNKYLSCVDNVTLRTGDVSWTWDFWAKFDNHTGNQVLIVKDGLSTFTRDYLIRREAASIFCYIPDGAALKQVSVASAGIGVYQYIRFSYDAVAHTLTGQTNNGTVSSVSTTGFVPNATVGSAFNIGRRASNDQYLDGALDEVGFWKGRVLTAAEITARYNSGNGNTHPFS